MKRLLNNSWQEHLEDEFEKPYYQNLRRFLIKEYNTKTVYPPMNDIYNALHLTDYKAVKVVILGQDPYHGQGQAHGLSFSVKEGIAKPPSLVNIFRELENDLNYSMPKSGNLEAWAKEGVLMLNAVLTVRKGEPNSHANMGWESLTDRIISILNDRSEPLVYILWGSYAQKKSKLITNRRHLVLKAPHPSPLSAYRGFFGSKPFSKVNTFLALNGIEAINWEV